MQKIQNQVKKQAPAKLKEDFKKIRSSAGVGIMRHVDGRIEKRKF